MDALHPDFRDKLEDAVTKARVIAEAGAKAALGRLAVAEAEPHSNLSDEQKKLRNALRAKARALGGVRDKVKRTQDVARLQREVAYEHWHRMLFARFLAENNLLLHPDHRVPVSIEDCKALADEESTTTGKRVDAWQLAARFASSMLPQIFRQDDPALALTFAPEHLGELEALVERLPVAVFQADDSLGWVYQYWQKEEKKRVNDSGQKITADTLPAVTQLFTEHYMVLFLVHNTIGAWHAGKVLAANPKLAESAASEDDLRNAVALSVLGGYNFEYLRFVRGSDGKQGPWRPAAGAFSGWPRQAAGLKMLDPCCGSGHFLVAVFLLVVRLRMADESLSVDSAIDAVLRDNLFGLELDARCTQIAAFNVALTAWKLNGEWKPLPKLHIACTGVGPNTPVEQWLELSEPHVGKAPLRERDPVRLGIRALHNAFSDAPTLGSLIDVNRVQTVGAADWETVRPYLDAAMKAEADDELHADAVGAAGIADAARILAGPEQGYTLVITNVPYLGRGKQDERVQEWADQYESDAKADLATIFVSRHLRTPCRHGTFAAVTPQSWLFLTSYRTLRERLLGDYSWNVVARLGPGAFETITGHVVNVTLLVLTNTSPERDTPLLGIDASSQPTPTAKADALRDSRKAESRVLLQFQQRSNPGSAIKMSATTDTELLGIYVRCFAGILNGDSPRFRRLFWELPRRFPEWVFQQSTVEKTQPFHGREGIIFYDDENGHLREDAVIRRVRLHDSDQRGNAAWGQWGVGVSQMSNLPVTLYTGEKFDSSIAVIFPKDQSLVPALWAYCSDDSFVNEIRAINQKMSVENGYIEKVPFDVNHWTQIAAERFPDGLPQPESDDATQWLFHGRPEASAQPLMVAVGRLVGYRWPPESDEKMQLSKRARALVKRCDELLPFADADGVIPIPALANEPAASERLRDLLEAAFGKDWSPEKADELLRTEAAPLKKKKPFASPEEYLRDGFFERHCSVFQNRPFVWQISDGEKDGFSVLVNCHKLCDGDNGRRLLEKIIYTYLGDWITRQQNEQANERSGAEKRLIAANELSKKLKLILAGEPPYDIFVRWKKLSEQPMGWVPDINDGVRMNIRPFVEAGILRKKVGSLNWNKDRGNEPTRQPQWEWPWFHNEKGEFTGERVNEIHLTLDQKREARARAKGGA